MATIEERAKVLEKYSISLKEIWFYELQPLDWISCLSTEGKRFGDQLSDCDNLCEWEEIKALELSDCEPEPLPLTEEIILANELPKEIHWKKGLISGFEFWIDKPDSHWQFDYVNALQHYLRREGFAYYADHFKVE